MKRVPHPLVLAAGLAAFALPGSAMAGGVKSPWQLRLLESCKPPTFVQKTQTEAAARDVEAMAAYGYLLSEACGAARDEEAAVRWWQAAASKGNGDAVFYLGVLFSGCAGPPRPATPKPPASCARTASAWRRRGTRFSFLLPLREKVSGEA